MDLEPGSQTGIVNLDEVNLPQTFETQKNKESYPIECRVKSSLGPCSVTSCSDWNFKGKKMKMETGTNIALMIQISKFQSSCEEKWV